MNTGERNRKGLAILYITATLLTAAACIALIVDSMGEAQQAEEGIERLAAGIAVIFGGMLFPPLFAAEWILWRAAVYFFCAPERTRRKTVFYSLYAVISLCIMSLCVSTPFALFALFASGEAVLLFDWGLLLVCALLKGVEALTDARSKGGKQ